MARSLTNSSTEASNQRIARKRLGGPRSKTGCITCRIRHVKCDEERPACSRCTKTGRTCDGYAVSSQPWDIVDFSSMTSMLMISSDPRTSTDQHAGRSFKFFEKMTSGYLSGLFESNLWKEVLRASHHNDAIWHAVTALGSAHEAYLHRKFDMSSCEEDWAIQQYNRAIRRLTLPDALGERPPLDVIMAVSILFMAFEMLRREYGKAINHIQSGISIFGERNAGALNASSDGSSLISTSQLEIILRQLETHLCELCMERAPVMPRRSLVGRKALPQDCPKVLDELMPPLPGFNTIMEARLELDGYWHNLMFILHEFAEPDVFHNTFSSEDFEEQSQAYTQAFSSWRQRFNILLQQLHLRPEPITSTERKAIAQLELYESVGTQILGTSITGDEMVWDKHEKSFEHVVDLCEIIADNSASIDGYEYPGFQLDNGIVVACFHTIWKCRTARTRQRALTLLSQQRQEGLWDAHLVAMVCKLIDEIERGPGLLEEASLRNARAAELPCWRRILRVDVVFSAEGKDAVISFVKQKSERDETMITIRKCLSW